jgi:Dna[CI] antecedent, DciA
VQPLSTAARTAVAALLRDVPLSAGKVDFAWKTVVGPAVQRATSVRLHDDTLIVETETAEWAREVARSIPIILPRLQDILGRSAVTAISVVCR